MRLRRIALENFRRHRQTVWEVPDGVTAVVGANGAGKSTILEAIAFALYGPRATRTAKDLLRFAGAAPSDSLSVTLDFELAGQAWTIVRELRGRSQEPRASIAIDGVVQVPPGGGSSEQATALVERAIGLDREGFFQTIVARQGELDKLAQMRPAERRSFILGMVGIGAVDDAIARAREKRNTLRAQLEEAKRDLDEPPVVEARLAQASVALAAASQEVAALRQRVEHAAAHMSATAAAHEGERAAEAARQVAVAEARLAVLRLEQSEAGARDAAVNLQASRTAQARLVAARQRAAPHDALSAHYHAMLQSEGLLRLRQAGLTRLAAQRQECSALEGRLRGLAALLAPADVSPLEASLAGLRAAELHLATQLGASNGHLAAVRDRLLRLGVLDDQAACPTCDQPLSGDHLVQAKQAAVLQEREGLAQTTALRSEHAKLQIQLRQAEAELAAALLAERAWRNEAARRKAETDKLAEKSRSIAEMEAGLPADPGSIEPASAVKLRLDEARRARDEALQLESTAASLPFLQEAETARTGELDAARRAAEVAAARLAAVPDNAAALLAANAAVLAANRAVADADAALLAASLRERDRQRDFQDAQRELERTQRRLEHAAGLAKTLATWTALAGTAGDGLLDRFKDHLVARTAPFIQEEASRLLALFTQGKYQELLLDEDYEVWISDGGARYSMDRFSGGEQDLVHLALRLATSRLLATRANGAELRLLALDEVFGGLDANHRDLVVAALQQLGGLYSQVLAITHDEALQELLDHAVRIELVDGEARLSAS